MLRSASPKERQCLAGLCAISRRLRCTVHCALCTALCGRPLLYSGAAAARATDRLARARRPRSAAQLHAPAGRVALQHWWPCVWKSEPKSNRRAVTEPEPELERRPGRRAPAEEPDRGRDSASASLVAAEQPPRVRGRQRRPPATGAPTASVNSPMEVRVASPRGPAASFDGG